MISNSKAFVQQTALPESIELKLFSYMIGVPKQTGAMQVKRLLERREEERERARAHPHRSSQTHEGPFVAPHGQPAGPKSEQKRFE
jgi:hypothetical protein